MRWLLILSAILVCCQAFSNTLTLPKGQNTLIISSDVKIDLVFTASDSISQPRVVTHSSLDLTVSLDSNTVSINFFDSESNLSSGAAALVPNTLWLAGIGFGFWQNKKIALWMILIGLCWTVISQSNLTTVEIQTPEGWKWREITIQAPGGQFTQNDFGDNYSKFSITSFTVDFCDSRSSGSLNSIELDTVTFENKVKFCAEDITLRNIIVPDNTQLTLSGDEEVVLGLISFQGSYHVSTSSSAFSFDLIGCDGGSDGSCGSDDSFIKISAPSVAVAQEGVSPSQVPASPSQTSTRVGSLSATKSPESATRTPSNTPSHVNSASSTKSAPQTGTPTPTRSKANTPASTPSQTPTRAASNAATPSSTRSAAQTGTPTRSAANTPASTPSQTGSRAASSSASPTKPASNSGTGSRTASVSGTGTKAAASVSSTASRTGTQTGTTTRSTSPASTPSATATRTPAAASATSTRSVSAAPSCFNNSDCPTGMCFNNECVSSINNCDISTATDLRQSSAVTITFPNGNFSYSPKCILVSAGTQVTFNGSFSPHPLVAGQIINSQEDLANSSPFIPTTSTGTTHTFTMSPGDSSYPYFCDAHGTGGMNGVVFVQ